MASGPHPDLAVKMSGIEKRYAGRPVLTDVNFIVEPGEIHALVGENGAGKTTLMEILAGNVPRDSGEVVLAGRSLGHMTARSARRNGIAIVHQETGLFPTVSVAENLLWDRRKSGRLLRRNRINREAREILARYDLRVHVEQTVASISSAQRKLLEIARIILSDPTVMIMDEPTAALGEHETKLLFTELRRCRDSGTAIVYISHRLDEVFEIADRVTVLRDGRVVGSMSVSNTNPREVVTRMVGRSIDDVYGRRAHELGATALEVTDLRVPSRVHGVSFSLRSGEIVGLGGMLGAGRSEVGLALFGLLPSAGEIRIDGHRRHVANPRRAIELGIGLVPEDRKLSGLFPRMSLMSNLSVMVLGDVTSGGVVATEREEDNARVLAKEFGIRHSSLRAPIGGLSGGNQQKALLAKWLSRDLRVLIVDEPTRGVDVGAKVDIYGLLREQAAKGVAILLVSSELSELIGMSDRILVLYEGHLMGELCGADRTEENVVLLGSGMEMSMLGEST